MSQKFIDETGTSWLIDKIKNIFVEAQFTYEYSSDDELLTVNRIDDSSSDDTGAT